MGGAMVKRIFRVSQSAKFLGLMLFLFLGALMPQISFGQATIKGSFGIAFMQNVHVKVKEAFEKKQK